MRSAKKVGYSRSNLSSHFDARCPEKLSMSLVALEREFRVHVQKLERLHGCLCFNPN